MTELREPRSTSADLIRQSLRLSKTLGLVSLVFPMVTAVGWIFDIPLLTQWHAALPAMQPNTAVGLTAAAVAIVMTPERPTINWRTPIILVLTSVVLLLGLLTLAEYGSGRDLGLDRILSHDAPSAHQPYPGRPSPQTSLNFVLVGVALISWNLGVWFQLGQVAAIAAAANSIAAATGFIFSTRMLYGFPYYAPAIGMAVHTAVTFLLLILALFCRRPRDGMMTLVTSETRSGAIARRSLVAGIVAPPFVGALTWLGVAAGWYDSGNQGALFVLALGGLILRTLWATARRAEREELQANIAFDTLERTNEQLRKAVGERQVFAALVENSPDFIGVADADGKGVYLNPAGRRMVGLAPDFAVEHTEVLEYYAPDQRTFASDVILKSMIEQGHWQGETAFRHWQSGKAIAVSDTHFMIREPGTGRLLGWGTITRDISELKRAREEAEHLRRQIEDVSIASTRISEAVASLPDESVQTVFQTIARSAQCLTDAELAAAGVGSDPTRPFETWTFVGLTPEQVAKIGRPPRPIGLLGLVSKNDRTLRLRDVREHTAHRGLPPHHPPITSFLGVPIRFRGLAVGNLFLANKRGGAEFTPDDERIAELLAERAGSAIETARLYAAEGRAHAWLQKVIDQLPEGIALMDDEGRVTMQNQALHALSAGRPPEHDRFGNAVTIDLRRSSGERVTPDEFPIVRALLGQGVTRAVEFVAHRSDDRPVPLLVSAAPIMTASGTLAGAAMVLQDISVLKELERLRQEWASVVAHDLRQPINAIMLRSSLLLRDGLSEKQRNEIRRINAAAQLLNRMASDLMDASLVDSHRLCVNKDRLDLGQLLRDVVERMSVDTERMTVNTPPGFHLFVRGDAQRLEQIVTNLLSNASKYRAPATGIQVELIEADGNAEIRVTNHGAGIPPDELPLVFDRFARTRGAMADRVQGLGLGLYIVKGLVAAHGGRIWAESVPGAVTTFHVAIPLDGPPVPASAANSAPPEQHVRGAA